MTTRPGLTLALLVATPGTTWGGMEKHTLDLALGMAQRGHRVHVLAHKDYRDRFPAEIHFHALPIQLGRRHPWLALSLRRSLRRIGPDLLHAHGNKAAQLAGRLPRGLVPHIVGTIHGIKSSHAAFQPLDQVIVVSPGIFEQLEHRKKHLIFNGIPGGAATADQEARPRAAGTEDHPPHCLAVGRLESVKGFDLLIEAWAGLSRPATLTICGEGSERGALQRQIQTLGLAGRVRLAGFQSDLSEAYQRADLTIISSRREGFSYVLIEALMAGCPVIATPVAGPVEFLPDQALSEDISARGLRELLARWLSDLAGLREAEWPAVERVRKECTLEAMLAKTEQVYREARG